MQSKILTSCLMAGVIITGSLASRAADTNAPAATPPGANGAPNAQAMPPRARPLPGAAAGGPMGVLSEEQRASYQKNIADKRAEMMELTSKLRTAQQDVNEMMFSLKVDEDQIRQKVMDEAKLEADMMILRAKAFAEIQPPVTEEELDKFKQAMTPRPMIRPTPPPQAAPSPSTPNPSQGAQPGKQ